MKCEANFGRCKNKATYTQSMEKYELYVCTKHLRDPLNSFGIRTRQLIKDTQFKSNED